MFALQSLARIGYAPAGRSILPLLHHSDPNVAQAAIEAVGQLRTREAVPALLKLVDGELWLQLAAINALGAIGAPEAVGPLMALVPDSVLAEPAVQALRSIAAPESLEPLLGAAAGRCRSAPCATRCCWPIGVVIDLHPDPAPLLERRRARAGGLRDARRLSRPGAAARVAGRRRGRRGESLQRAAATLIAAAGLEALEPALLARLATDPEAALARGPVPPIPRGPGRAADPARRRSEPRRAERRACARPGSRRTSCPSCSSTWRTPTRTSGPRPATPWAGSSSTRPRRSSPSGSAAGEPVEQAAAAQALGPPVGGGAGRARELPPRPRADEAVLALALRGAGRPAGARLRGRRAPPRRGPPAAPFGGPRLRAAARLPGSRTDVLLLRALADRHQATQVEALDLLVARGGDQSVAVLVAMLGTADSLRFHVIRALGHCRAPAGGAQAAGRLPGVRPARAAPDRRGAHPDRAAVDRRVPARAPGRRRGRDAAHGGAGPRRPGRRARARPCCCRSRTTPTGASATRWPAGLGRLAKPATRHVLLALARDVEPVVAATARASLERLQPEAVRISA